jgi:heterodisulfide reductase subunit C
VQYTDWGGDQIASRRDGDRSASGRCVDACLQCGTGIAPRTSQREYRRTAISTRRFGRPAGRDLRNQQYG